MTPRTWWTVPRKIGAGFVATITFAAAVVTFLPRVTVDVTAPETPSDSFSSAFVARNGGIVPLWHVSFFVGICAAVLEVTTADKRTVRMNLVGTPDRPVDPTTTTGCVTPNGSRYSAPPWQNHRLTIDEPFSAELSDVLPALLGAPPQKGWVYRMKDADITIITSFDPWFIPYNRRAEFRFTAKEQMDGTLRWFPRTLDNR